MGWGGNYYDDRKFGVSRKIMLAAIVSLVGVVILMILLHLYARYLLRRQERRRRRAALNYQRTDQIAPIDIESFTDELPPPKSGLDPLVIAALPMFTYKLITSQVDGDQSTECSVCLGTIMEESAVRLLPNCKHFFHVECIDTWLGSQTTCPICRTVAEPTVRLAAAKEVVEPTAPPVEENASHSAAQVEKEGGASGSESGSRFGSFRSILGWERSSSRIQSCGDEIGTQDLER